jgi:hypothetical protein
MKHWILLAIAMVPAQGQTPKPGTVQFLPQSLVQQSFVPAHGCLNAGEVELVPGNPSPQTSVTLKIMDGSKVLTSKSKQVLPDFHGDLRFDFSTNTWSAVPKAGRRTAPTRDSGGCDRLVQQAILQVLNPILDPTSSNSSYGFRPGRDAQMALEPARKYVSQEEDGAASPSYPISRLQPAQYSRPTIGHGRKPSVNH